MINISGANASSGAALQIKGPSCTIRGLAIADWSGDAIEVFNVSGTSIVGNYIGLDADGASVLGNNSYGINLTGSNVQIGGTTPDVANVIVGNASGGVNIANGSNNVVQGNLIGVIGSAAAGSQGTAVTISGPGATGNLIGGSVPGAGNYIAANASATSDAIYLSNCSSNTVQGNLIGTDPTGTASFGDTANGIQINGASYNTIGGLAAGSGNVIAFSAGAGVWVTNGANNAILGNSIFFNSGLGIDLGTIGVQANDSLDADTGANNLQNYPVITNSMCDGTNTVVQGTLDSAPSTVFRIEFYRNNVCDSTGYGQAKTYIGSTNVITSASGIVSFKATIPTGPIAGQYITATATDPAFNTSEISGCSVVNGVQMPTILAPLGGLLGILGQPLTLSIDVAGTQSLKYQWRLNGTPILGATNALYSILSLLPINAGAYSVVVYNGLGAAHSEPALVGILGLLQAPMADNFADRGTFNGITITASGNNTGATSEPNEPLHAGKPGGKSMWVTWVPTLSGVATVSTVGSSFDTLLGIYRGTTLANLTSVASDDESGGYHTSQVKFNVTGGTPYIIAVDGASGQSGHIILNCSLATLVSVASVTQQPVDKTVGTNMSASFSVDATGSSLTYQWYFNGTAIGGATGWTYSLNSVTTNLVGLYQVKLQSGSQTVFGTPAQLQINYSDGGVDSNARAYDKLSDAVFAQAVIATQHIHQHSAPARGFTGTQVFSTYNSTQAPANRKIAAYLVAHRVGLHINRLTMAC